MYIILEIEAALFVYGKKLGFEEKRGMAATTVAQIDLVPSLSLLLGILFIIL